MNALFLSLLTTMATLIPGWQLNFDQAKVEASQNHKLILLNFSGSDWCGPCIKLKKTVFESAPFEQFAAEHLILVRADFPGCPKTN